MKIKGGDGESLREVDTGRERETEMERQRESNLGSERQRGGRFTSESLTAHWVSVGVKQSSLLPSCASLPEFSDTVLNTAPLKKESEKRAV